MSKLRILIAWELGANFGHLAPLLSLARLLRQRGHELLFAVKELTVAGQLPGWHGFRSVQAPIPGKSKLRRHEPASFADILSEAGFDDGNILYDLSAAWQGLFDDYRPDILVAQYAPTAQLAARLAALPCLSVGTGFECPPDATPYPCFRPWLKLGREELLARERKILDTINELFAPAGWAPFASLQQPLRADLTLLSTLPELDHYPGRRGGSYIGPLFADEGEEWHWPENDAAPRIFVYLRPFRGLPTILTALQRIGAQVIAIIPGITDQQRTLYADKRLRIGRRPIRISSIIETAETVITHGGHGLAAAAMLAGAPVLSIPTTIEQWLTSRNLEKLGTGIGVSRRHVGTGFATALDTITSEPSYRRNAGIVARRYELYDQKRVVERLANTIERLPESFRMSLHAKTAKRAPIHLERQQA